MAWHDDNHLDQLIARTSGASLTSADSGTSGAGVMAGLREWRSASVAAWPTTWRSRQHSARRLSRRYDVLPPCRYIRSIASRALSAAWTAASLQRARCSRVVSPPAATVFQISVIIALRYARPAFRIASARPTAS